MSEETPASNVVEEFTKSPVQVTMTVANGIIAAVSLYFSWRSTGGSFAAPTVVAPDAGASPYLISIAAFVSTATCLALVARFINVVGIIAGFFSSIVIAVVAMLVISLVFRSQGVILGSAADTQQLIILGTMFLFAALTGGDILARLKTHELEQLSTMQTERDASAASNSSLLLLAAVWFGVVYAGGIRVAEAVLI